MAGRSIPGMALQLHVPSGSARVNTIPVSNANLAVTVLSIGASARLLAA